MEIQQGDMEKLSADPSPRYPCGLWSLSLREIRNAFPLKAAFWYCKKGGLEKEEGN